MRKRWREQYESAAYNGHAKGNLYSDAYADGEQHKWEGFAVVAHNVDPHGKLEPARRKDFRATRNCQQSYEIKPEKYAVEARWRRGG
jgi:hypothetical protein